MVRYVLIIPCWILLVVVIRGRRVLDMALGPVFSNQVWSIIWLAAVCPRARLSLGVRRCMIEGKKPSMFEKWWVGWCGMVLNCLFVRDASSRAMSSPMIVTVRAASLRGRGIDMIGVLEGSRFEVINSPATMLPQASRLMGLITARLFSLMGDRALNRG